jgi:hypothetical protein
VPAEEDAPGERLRIEIGEAGALKRETFLFDRTLAQPSTLLTVTLSRPMGIVFVPDSRGRCRVGSLVEGSAAGRAASVGRLSPGGSSAAMVGDVLRACTATQFQFPATVQTQLLGDLKGTKRVVVLYGADGAAWSDAFAVLRQGLVSDGPVTLILERPGEGTADEAWAALPVTPRLRGEDDVEEERSLEAFEAMREQEQMTIEGPSGDTLLVGVSAIASFLLLLWTGFQG